MKRIHLFEFEDLPWFPHVLRESMTDFLSFLGELARDPYREFVTRLRTAMQRSGQQQLIDLCSGGGGPARAITALLAQQENYPVTITLTDLFPNLKRFERMRDLGDGRIQFVREPVDATRVPATLPGFRLLVNGFHHFPPDAARAILGDAVAHRQGIALFEGIERSLTGFVQLFFSLGGMFVIMPFVRPFRWSRLFFTYVIPAVPLFTVWDGVVSCLRMYSPAELRELVDSLPPNDFIWDIGQARVPGTPMRITYLIGSPPSA